jgi:hypothetical protein
LLAAHGVGAYAGIFTDLIMPNCDGWEFAKARLEPFYHPLRMFGRCRPLRSPRRLLLHGRGLRAPLPRADSTARVCWLGTAAPGRAGLTRLPFP